MLLVHLILEVVRVISQDLNRWNFIHDLSNSCVAMPDTKNCNIWDLTTDRGILASYQTAIEPHSCVIALIRGEFTYNLGGKICTKGINQVQVKID